MKKLMNLLLIPLIITVVGSVVAVVLEHELNKGEGTGSTPALNITSTRDTLVVTNNTSQVLRVRVAYRVSSEGQTTDCYPDLPPDEGGEDALIWPGGTLSFPPRHCRNVIGYRVWAWDNQSQELVFDATG